MIAYFARRLLGGVVMLFVSLLAIFSWTNYGPSNISEGIRRSCIEDCYHPDGEFYKEIEAYFHIDQPWPISYLTWLFDPNGPKHFPWSRGDNVAEEGQAVTPQSSEWLGQFLLVLVFPLVCSMMVIAVQRRRRSLAVGPPNYPKSRNLLPQYEHPMRVLGL
jgi:ABC-type dipeptide/oligopeptide/nickel transport system permease component